MLRLSPPALLELEKNDHWTLPLLVLDIESFQIFAATHNLNIQNSTIKVYLLRLSLYLRKKLILIHSASQISEL